MLRKEEVITLSHRNIYFVFKLVQCTVQCTVYTLKIRKISLFASNIGHGGVLK